MELSSQREQFGIQCPWLDQFRYYVEPGQFQFGYYYSSRLYWQSDSFPCLRPRQDQPVFRSGGRRDSHHSELGTQALRPFSHSDHSGTQARWQTGSHISCVHTCSCTGSQELRNSSNPELRQLHWSEMSSARSCSQVSWSFPGKRERMHCNAL